MNEQDLKLYELIMKIYAEFRDEDEDHSMEEEADAYGFLGYGLT